MPRSFAFGVYPGCVPNPAKLYPSVSGSTEATMEYRTLRFGFASGKMHPKNMELGQVAREEEFLEKLGVGAEAIQGCQALRRPHRDGAGLRSSASMMMEAARWLHARSSARLWVK